LYHFPAGHVFKHADPITESVPTGHAAEQIDALAAENNPVGHCSQTPLLLYVPALHAPHVPGDPSDDDEPGVNPVRNVLPVVQVGEFEKTVSVVDVHVAVTYCVPVGWLHAPHVPGDPSDDDEPGVNPVRNVLPVVQVGEFEKTVFVVDVHVAVTYCVPVGWLHVVHVPGDPSDDDEPGVNPVRNGLPVVQVGEFEKTVFVVDVHVAVTYCVPVGWLQLVVILRIRSLYPSAT
jgi:hypothetical protein